MLLLPVSSLPRERRVGTHVKSLADPERRDDPEMFTIYGASNASVKIINYDNGLDNSIIWK